MLRKLAILLLVLVPAILFASWLMWFWSPVTTLDILLIDKTVISDRANEHRALIWLLVHERFQGTREPYTLDSYYGPVPEGDGTFATRDFHGLSADRLDSLADRHDMAFVVDSYGIFERSWREQYPSLGPTTSPQQRLYGGLDTNDMAVLRRIAEQRKLLIVEFNTLQPPTPVPVREELERLLGLRWTGWTGRAFASLDSTETDMPSWVVQLYSEQYGGWPFRREPGIVLIHLDERIVVLASPRDLTHPVPRIAPIFEELGRLHTPKELVDYAFWFDIVEPDSTMAALAYFILPVRPDADTLLTRYGIPRTFPAVLEQPGARLKYYFAGDFSDYPPVNELLAYFRGSRELRTFLYTDEDPWSRSEFYWTFYYPLVHHILHAYVPPPRAR